MYLSLPAAGGEDNPHPALSLGWRCFLKAPLKLVAALAVRITVISTRGRNLSGLDKGAYHGEERFLAVLRNDSFKGISRFCEAPLSARTNQRKTQPATTFTMRRYPTSQYSACDWEPPPQRQVLHPLPTVRYC